ncbi:MAG: phosphonate ABC transporter ATP-binding protein, partial [Synechococcaceae bacterium WB9_4xB_025]|nr:phosphonate ABC transporter ATP-binding protein [Synechococcaceae bacterium WB9_4xB_025]
VLLADEPLASLDPALIDELLTRLLRQTSAETVLISLHRPDLIHRFDRVIGLRKGQLVLDLRPSDLQSGQLDALYSS